MNLSIHEALRRVEAVNVLRRAVPKYEGKSRETVVLALRDAERELREYDVTAYRRQLQRQGAPRR